MQILVVFRARALILMNFNPGGLQECHAVTTQNCGTVSDFALKHRKNQENLR
jgi:hypothetical protein